MVELTKIDEDIFIYRKFLTDEESDAIKAVIEEYAERDPEYWKVISFYESYSAGYPDAGDPLFEKHGLPSDFLDKLYWRYVDACAELAGIDRMKVSKISFHIQRWLPGAFAPLHSDNSDEHGKLGAFTRSRYAGFLYLNDDFTGGLLKFQAQYGKKELTVVPEKGMFAIFHGGHKNMHQVTPIESGTRYTIGSFFDDREESDYTQEERDAWATELAEVRALQKEEQKVWAEVKEEGYRLTPQGQKYRLDG